MMQFFDIELPLLQLPVDVVPPSITLNLRFPQITNPSLHLSAMCIEAFEAIRLLNIILQKALRKEYDNRAEVEQPAWRIDF